MAAAVDHVFVCTSPGGAVAECLRRFGLAEGPPNRHSGQGTACRRFFFENCMLELLWMADAAEAQSEKTRPTRLWERCSGQGSPFGVILQGTGDECPFESWEYRLGDLVLRIAPGADLAEPMWCYVEQYPRRRPPEHPAGVRQVTGVQLVLPPLPEASVTAAMARMGIVGLESGPVPLMRVEFDGGRLEKAADFRPDLPLMFRW